MLSRHASTESHPRSPFLTSLFGRGMPVCVKYNEMFTEKKVILVNLRLPQSVGEGEGEKGGKGKRRKGRGLNKTEEKRGEEHGP